MIVNSIYAHAQAQPQRLAIVSDGQPVTYLRFARYIEFLRKAWVHHALPAGSVAVVVSHNRLLGWTATLALQSLGLVTVGADAVAGLRGLNLRRVSCMLLVNVPHEAVGEAVAHWPGALRLELPHDPGSAIQQVDVPGSVVSSPGGGHILYTSGTTGTYKKIFHDAALDHLRHAARLTVNGNESASVTNISFYGPWTAVGYRQPLFLWACGATLVVDRRADWPQRLGEHGVTRVFLTPGPLELAAHALAQSASTAGPRWSFELLTGGGVTSASLIRLVRERITPHLNLSFGCTETWLPVMRTNAQGLDDDFWFKPTGSREIGIVDEQGQPCPDMVEGLLRIKLQPTDYDGYMDEPEITARVFREGWFYPGDMAMRRADGRIRVLGRTGDVINVRGNKIASAAIEEALREALGASAVCAFSGLMGDNEDRIVIAVETATPIAPKRYQQVAGQLLKGMGDVHFAPMKAFPRTSTGTFKIDRKALRHQVMKRRPAQP